MSIKKYSDYISLHEQKSKTIGFRPIQEAARSDKGLHIHTDEGKQTIHITDLPHSTNGVKSLHKKIGEGLYKNFPTHYRSPKHAFQSYIEDRHESDYLHHELSNDKSNKKMTSDEYVAGEVEQERRNYA